MNLIDENSWREVSKSRKLSNFCASFSQYLAHSSKSRSTAFIRKSSWSINRWQLGRKNQCKYYQQSAKWIMLMIFNELLPRLYFLLRSTQLSIQETQINNFVRTSAWYLDSGISYSRSFLSKNSHQVRQFLVTVINFQFNFRKFK
jgi:hypothetical protein